MIPVYTIPTRDLETAISHLASGACDIMILQASSFGRTAEEIEDLLEDHRDLPGNWAARCIIIADRRSSEPPVWIRGTGMAVNRALARSLRGTAATDFSSPVANMMSFCFSRPISKVLKQPLFPFGFLVAVLWLCTILHARSARGRVFPAVSILVSAVLAAFLWWIVITGWSERKALTETIIRLTGRPPLPAELDEFLSSESAVKRYATLRYLENRSDPDNAQRALRLLSDSDARVRGRAMHLLGTILKKDRSKPLRDQALPRILEAFYDRSFRVRYMAAETAALARFSEAKPELMALVEKNEHLYVTWYAVNALRRLDPGK
jgi:hypothetical protein